MTVAIMARLLPDTILGVRSRHAVPEQVWSAQVGQWTKGPLAAGRRVLRRDRSIR